MICPNCNAEIENEVDKCPYCGFINMEGAQKKYKEQYNDVKAQIAETKKEPAKALRKGFAGGFKVILLTVGVLLVVAILYFLELLREMRNEPKMFLNAEEKAYASAYKEKAGEELAIAYDAKDIKQMAVIFDKAYSEDRVSIWGVPYYQVGQAASYYMKLQQCLPNLDKKKIKTKEAKEITFYCFYFYYKAYGEDGIAIFDEIRENEILPIIENRLGFTAEDMQNFQTKVVGKTTVNRSNVYRVTRKHYKNYH